MKKFVKIGLIALIGLLPFTQMTKLVYASDMVTNSNVESAQVVKKGVRAGEVLIDAITFPDETFRKYVSEQLDGRSGGSKDGILSVVEQNAIVSIVISSAYSGIEDLKGIEVFTKLKKLEATAAWPVFLASTITNANLTSNTELEEINLWGQPVNVLDTSTLVNLEELLVGLSTSESKMQINLINNINLVELNLSNIDATNLDFSTSPNLERLVIMEASELSVLNVTNNTKLQKIQVVGTKVPAINTTQMPALTSLMFGRSKLAGIDVTKNTLLESLLLANNELKTIDLSKNTKLAGLDVSKNQLTTLDVSTNALLKVISAFENKLLYVDTANNPILADPTVNAQASISLWSQNQDIEMTYNTSTKKYESPIMNNVHTTTQFFDKSTDVSVGKVSTNITYNQTTKRLEAKLQQESVEFETLTANNKKSDRVDGTLTLTHKGTPPPALSGITSIQVQDKTIEVGTAFDPMKGVSASDTVEGDLTSKVTYTGSVDANKIGKYVLEYSVKNADGVIVRKEVVITVVAKEKPTVNTEEKNKDNPTTKPAEATKPQSGKSVATGDTTNMMLLVTILGASLGVFFVIVGKKKKVIK